MGIYAFIRLPQVLVFIATSYSTIGVVNFVLLSIYLQTSRFSKFRIISFDPVPPLLFADFSGARRSLLTVWDRRPPLWFPTCLTRKHQLPVVVSNQTNFALAHEDFVFDYVANPYTAEWSLQQDRLLMFATNKTASLARLLRSLNHLANAYSSSTNLFHSQTCKSSLGQEPLSRWISIPASFELGAMILELQVDHSIIRFVKHLD